MSKKNGPCWQVPVVSESTRSTATYLLIAEGTEKEAAINYLLDKQIWNKSISDTAMLVHCLLSQGEHSLARKVSQMALSSRSRKTLGRGNPALDDAPSLVLRKGLSWLYPSGSEQLAKLLIKGLFYSTGKGYWTNRSSQVYTFVPLVLASMTKDIHGREKLLDILRYSQNRDGSCGGIAVATIICAYMLRELGDEAAFKRALRWVKSLVNENGSVRPILFQDVYDTAWAAIYFRDESSNSKSIRWLDETRVGAGYPYLSTGFHPDCDDTSLVRLATRDGNDNSPRNGSLGFLLDGQNPDGGWGYISLWSLREALPYRILAAHSSLVRLVAKRLGPKAFWNPSFDSTVDMTSRVMISLANEPNINAKKLAVKRGIAYLQSQYREGFYRDRFRWTNSDFFESSLALVALQENGVSDANTTNALNNLLSLSFSTGDEAAHVLWAGNSAGITFDKLGHVVEFLLDSQCLDGSWTPGLKFKADAYFIDPFFSTILPLTALKMLT